MCKGTRYLLNSCINVSKASGGRCCDRLSARQQCVLQIALRIVKAEVLTAILSHVCPEYVSNFIC